MPRISDHDNRLYELAEAEARKLAIKRKREALHLADDDDGAEITAPPDEADIIDLIVDRIDWNEYKERLKKAKYIVTAKTRPDPDKWVTHQMWLPGLENRPRDFDEELRVRNNSGQLEKLPDCPPEFIAADAQRSRAHRHKVDEADDFKRVRSDLYQQWTIAELRRGRVSEELLFKTFLAESGFLKPKPADEPPRPEPSADDDDD
jgi:hypothetical protein